MGTGKLGFEQSLPSGMGEVWLCRDPRVQGCFQGKEEQKGLIGQRKCPDGVGAGQLNTLLRDGQLRKQGRWCGCHHPLHFIYLSTGMNALICGQQ